MNKSSNCYKAGIGGQTNQTGASKNNRAFTLVELLAVIAVITLLATTFLAAQINMQFTRNLIVCMTNLKQVGIAFRTWEGDYGNKYPMSVPSDKGGSMDAGTGKNMFRSYQVMSNEINNPGVLICPTDDRQPAVDFQHMSNDNLSYFVGLVADETKPGRVLSGDRNLVTNGVDAVSGLVVVTTPQDTVGWSEKMHTGIGNIGLADGSVQQTSSSRLQLYFNHSGTNVNRLAVP